MADNASFYFGIFKKLQACDGSIASAGGHFVPDINSAELSGGFSLAYPSSPAGILGHLKGSSQTCPMGMAGKRVLGDSTNTDPKLSPLFTVLNATKTGQVGSVLVKPENVLCPTMPLGGNASNPFWVEVSTATHDVVSALGTWISNGAKDDTPKLVGLGFEVLAQSPPKLFPGLTVHGKNPFITNPVLFVCSMAGDDGRRPGDLGLPPVAADHVPEHFWQTSQIFLLNAVDGTAHSGILEPTDKCHVVAVIGNCGNWPAGRATPNMPTIHVQCDAQAFNTAFSHGVPLATLSDLNTGNPGLVYEQYFLGAETYDIVGFRFDVQSIYNGLETVLENSGMLMGGITAAEWLAGSHPCVRVWIASGETQNDLNPAWNNVPALASNPRTDRHIAQHNLDRFDIKTSAPKKIGWKNFVVPQVGPAGNNRLVLEHDLPPALRFYIAVPTATYARHIRKGGGIRNFEEVHDAASKPFPDAIILRETHRRGEIDVAEHLTEMFLGMSLGIEYETQVAGPIGSVSLVHFAPDGGIAGGFTIEIAAVTDGTARAAPH